MGDEEGHPDVVHLVDPIGYVEFLGLQRRFHHLVQKDGANGAYKVRAGREPMVDRLKAWTQSNVERLYRLAELK